MDRSPGRIVLDLDPGADPIADWVRIQDQPPRNFTGWTGLFAALRAATGEDSREDSASGDGAAGGSGAPTKG